MSNPQSAVVIGAGPAGLTAAYELLKHNVVPTVLEQDVRVGGIARTEEYKGYRFDIGGHRFYTKVSEVDELWHEVMGAEFQKRPRLSRIYYNGQFYHYPLKIFNTMAKLGALESFRIMVSYMQAKIRPARHAETLEEWVCDCFGERLYRTFFKTYTEKVWGIPCNQIQAEWAAQRIQGLSLKVALLNALTGGRRQNKSLIDEFEYPIHGPGMMWEMFQARINEQGGAVKLQTEVTGVQREGNRVTSITTTDEHGSHELQGDYFVSSMPLVALVRQLDPPPPADVLAAADGLRYRDFLIVTLIVDRAETFPDNWIYIHDPEVQVGRIQNFKNWSPAMVPDMSKTSLGMEYFCNETDDLWLMADDALIAQAASEMETLGLGQASDVIDGRVIRQRKAYPVYDGEYRQHLEVIRNYLNGFENLQTIGRNGMHRYNNQDHSMLTGLLAARNLVGEEHDLWDVNTERSYYEEFEVKSKTANQRPVGSKQATAPKGAVIPS